jgi:hypothetical protein
MADGSVMFKGVWKKMLLCIRNRRQKGVGVVMAMGMGCIDSSSWKTEVNRLVSMQKEAATCTRRPST